MPQVYYMSKSLTILLHACIEYRLHGTSFTSATTYTVKFVPFRVPTTQHFWKTFDLARKSFMLLGSCTEVIYVTWILHTGHGLAERFHSCGEVSAKSLKEVV